MLPQDIHIEGQQVEILPEWRAKMEEELARLQQHYTDPILHARVEVIGTAHHHLGAFEIRLAATIPGDTITISRQGDLVVPLLVEAFDVLDRRLSEHARMRQMQVKTHEEFVRLGQVAKIFPERDYGFILDQDGISEVYFHAHAVKKGRFSDLAPGSKVKFSVEEGEKGPQAIWVHAE